MENAYSLHICIKMCIFFLEMHSCHLCQQSSKDVQRLSCGCYVHLKCFRECSKSAASLECPRCGSSVTKAVFLKEECEWIIGIPARSGLHGCFKVMPNSKIIPYHEVRSKWLRRNGRLVALEILDMNVDVCVI